MERDGPAQRPRVCFVRIEAGPLFFAEDRGGIGGAEVRSALFAKALAQRGQHEVSFVVGAKRTSPPRVSEGVRVHFLRVPRQSRDRNWSLSLCWQWPADMARRLARSVQDRLPMLPRAWPFFCQLDADALLCFGLQHPMVHAVVSARRSGKKSVLFLVQDLDDDFPPPRNGRVSLRRRRDMAWRRLALEQADAIVAQSETQREALRARFGREAWLIRNPLVTQCGAASRPPDVPPRYVLWVGRSDHRGKRSDLALELVRRNPETPFVLIMNPCSAADRARCAELRRDNVVLLPHVPFGRIDPYFRYADALVNTSHREGFPNAFLQAAQHGVPIVTLRVDPDGMLSRHGCGLTAGGSLDTLSRLLQRIRRGGPEVAAMSRAGRQYVRSRHDARGRIDELSQLLRSLVAGDGSSKAA